MVFEPNGGYYCLYQRQPRVRYHLTVPFCPKPFALHIGREIRDKALQVEGINEVEVIVQDHNQADEINEELRA